MEEITERYWIFPSTKKQVWYVGKIEMTEEGGGFWTSDKLVEKIVSVNEYNKTMSSSGTSYFTPIEFTDKIEARAWIDKTIRNDKKSAKLKADNEKAQIAWSAQDSEEYP